MPILEKYQQLLRITEKTELKKTSDLARLQSVFHVVSKAHASCRRVVNISIGFVRNTARKSGVGQIRILRSESARPANTFKVLMEPGPPTSTICNKFGL